MTNKLKMVRERKGFTQYELGRLLGKYQSWVWQIENSYSVPSEQEKEALAKVLEVDVDEVFPEMA